MDPTNLPLHDAVRERYINYALSVITSRALPDVRDGLKPVQRRILYAMYINLKLTPDARYRKSAAVVGEVMAKYHPHGDSSIYEAMVRMAQDFSMLHPLVDGQGNFGSIDGDNAAAMRYTEVRLRPMAMELLTELKQQTVPFRPTYDGQHSEPVLLPAQYPNVLVNGVEGIAVGMATRIPPHNLREIIDACVHLIDHPEATVLDLVKKVKAPDFPTGGEITSGADDLLTVYTEGQGPVRLRGTWEREQKGRKHFVIVKSVPFAVKKSEWVEAVGAAIRDRKLPQLVDVRDESTDEIRVVLELRAPEDAEAAMAWLYKHTDLQTLFHVNLTVLTPTDNPEVGSPARLNLREVLRYWLDFRCDTVRKRTQYDVTELQKRIHILEGYAKVFPILDEVIRIIRASEGKRDAAERLMDRFGLSDEQVEAILELRLYRLARLEINLILEELAEKQGEAEKLLAILASNVALWQVVRDELLDIRKQHGVARRTTLLNANANAAPELAYSEDAYIVQEDAIVVITRDGWLKRQGSLTGIDKVRVREGDSVGWALRSSTIRTLTLLSNTGTAYTLRVDSISPSTGYGDPVQKMFAFGDREKIIAVISHDPRQLPALDPAVVVAEDEAPLPHVIGVSAQGRIARLGLGLFSDVSTKNGRRFMRLEESNDAVVNAWVSVGNEHVCLASLYGNVLTFPMNEVGVLKAAGKGLTAITLNDEDSVFAAEPSVDPKAGPHVLTALGREEIINPARFGGKRAARGKSLFKRGNFAKWTRSPDVRLGKPVDKSTEGEN
jgi:DNA gyrase subunit A